MYPPILSTLILFCLATYEVPVNAMRQYVEPGWEIIWPGAFFDKRLRLHDSAVVYAWPSSGGRLELQNPSAFELDILGIEDYFAECNRSTDPVEEDAFALKLRRLSGTFSKHRYGIKVHENLAAEIHTWLGWPEDDEHKGGVWMLNVTTNDALERQTGRIRLATTMQDRCRVIRLCGGTFYASPTEDHLVPIEHVEHPCGMDAQEYGRHQREFMSFQS